MRKLNILKNLIRKNITFAESNVLFLRIRDLQPYLTQGERFVSKMAAASTQKEHIEVERKFIIPENFEEKLFSIGATLMHQKSFRDVYYDNKSYLLTLNDTWLRQREERWELKCPPEKRHHEKGEKTSQYAEYEIESDIIQKCSTILSLDTKSVKSVSDFVKAADLTPVVTLVTDRKSFSLNNNFRIDLDIADFGYRIGEIELLVEKGEDIEQAMKRIDEVAQKLGVQNTNRIQGKIRAYIKKYNKEHFDLLVAADVAKGISTAADET